MPAPRGMDWTSWVRVIVRRKMVLWGLLFVSRVGGEVAAIVVGSLGSAMRGMKGSWKVEKSTWLLGSGPRRV
jgi:hypothetical protein